MKHPFLIGLLSSSLFFPAVLHAEDASGAEAKVKAVVIIDNPEALRDVVFKSGKAPSDGKVNLDGTLERINPLPEEERADSSPSGPLKTDDTGTQAKHGIEVNVFGNCDRSRNGSSCESVVGIDYGITDNLEVSFEKSVVREHEHGEAPFRGAGPTEIGVKYRFYDKNGFSMAVAPSYEFNDATRHRDENGEKEPGEGNVVYLPLIISKEMGKFTTVANIGYKRNLQNHENSYVTSLAVGRSLSETSRVMAEIYSERRSHFENQRTDVRVGWVKMIFPKSKNFETSVFTSIGRSIGYTEDGKPHTSVNFGISISPKAH